MSMVPADPSALRAHLDRHGVVRVVEHAKDDPGERFAEGLHALFSFKCLVAAVCFGLGAVALRNEPELGIPMLCGVLFMAVPWLLSRMSLRAFKAYRARRLGRLEVPRLLEFAHFGLRLIPHRGPSTPASAVVVGMVFDWVPWRNVVVAGADGPVLSLVFVGAPPVSVFIERACAANFAALAAELRASVRIEAPDPPARLDLPGTLR